MVVPPLQPTAYAASQHPGQLYDFWTRTYRLEAVLALVHAALGNLWWEDLSILRNTPMSTISTVTHNTCPYAPEGNGLAYNGPATGGATV